MADTKSFTRTGDKTFRIVLDDFHVGISPAAHLDSLTQLGNPGNASVMTNIDVLVPKQLTQGPGLANLTNGTQAGVVDQLINFIMDRPASSDATYGIGTTKLYKISSTAVSSGGSPSWPRTITGAEDGESCIEFQGRLKYFYNTSTVGVIGDYDLASTFDDDWGSTIPTGAGSLQLDIHPSAKKEDILAFGNGRYFGTYINSTTTLNPTKLDFGINTQVADVAFHANQWWIAVNEGISGTNRTNASLFLYDGSAVSSILFDEVAVGVQRIGFIMPINGVMFVCWEDLSGENVLGYVSGRSVVPLAHFTGNLPTFEKKTLYQDFLLFESSGLIYAAGTSVDGLPHAISQLADAGYATAGGLAAPFGTPMVASTDGGSNQRLAQFSGYDTACTWKSIIFDVMDGSDYGFIDKISVLTNHLGAGASVAMTLEGNQAQDTSSTMTIDTDSQRRHVFTSRNHALDKLEDVRVAFSFSGGSTTNNVIIRKVVLDGHFVEAR